MTGASREDIVAFLARDFPQSAGNGVIESVGGGRAVIRQAVDDAHLRPGGTVSGPTLMALADFALYVAILGEIGIVPLAVTTSLNFNFLRKPAAGADLVAECRLLKCGRSLAVGEVSIRSDGSADPVAHATGTYAIPPRDRG